jgi:hypothetical protein
MQMVCDDEKPRRPTFWIVFALVLAVMFAGMFLLPYIR